MTAGGGAVRGEIMSFLKHRLIQELWGVARVTEKIVSLSAGICDVFSGCAPKDICAVTYLWFLNEMDLNEAEARETRVLTRAPLPTSDTLPELPIPPPAESG